MRHAPTSFNFAALLLVFVMGSLGCTFNSQNATVTGQSDTAITAATPPVTGKADPNDEILNTVRNEIDGVGIGSTFDETVKRFGKPSSIKKGGTNPCGGTKTVLRYPGLSFTLDEDDSKQNIVVLIEVTASKWEIAPGIKIGSSLEEVRSKMRHSGVLTKENKLDLLIYYDGDGTIKFYFRTEELVRIERDLNLC